MFGNSPELAKTDRFLADHLQEIEASVKNLDLLSLDNSELEILLQQLIQKFRLGCPVLEVADAHISSEHPCLVDVSTRADRHVLDRSRPFMVEGKSITVTIPVRGNCSLIASIPRSPNGITGEASIGTDSINLDYKVAHPIDVAELDREVKNDIRAISANIGFCLRYIESFNQNMHNEVRKILRNRRETLLVNCKSIEGLSIPTRIKIPEAVLESSTHETGYRAKPVKNGRRKMIENEKQEFDYDVFICHASEDKEEVVEALAAGLESSGVRVWYDSATLRIGDNLRQKIDEGLLKSEFGIVVFSPAFFNKQWTQRELDGLTEKEMRGGKKVILPVWHNVSHSDVYGFSPPLADKIAGSTKNIPKLISELVEVIGSE